MARPINLEARERILRLHADGKTGVEIAREVGITPASVAYHLRQGGILPVARLTVAPIIGGKRVCAVCGANKNVTEYRSPRDAKCAPCARRAKS